MTALDTDDLALLNKTAVGLVQVRGQHIHRLFGRTSEAGTPVTRRATQLEEEGLIVRDTDGVYELTASGQLAVEAAIRDATTQSEKAKLLRAGEVAELAGVALSTVTLWTNEGVMPCRRLPAGHRRFVRGHVLPIIRGKRLAGGLWGVVDLDGGTANGLRAAANFDCASRWVRRRNEFLPGRAYVTDWQGSEQAHAVALEQHVRKAIR